MQILMKQNISSYRMDLLESQSFFYLTFHKDVYNEILDNVIFQKIENRDLAVAYFKSISKIFYSYFEMFDLSNEEIKEIAKSLNKKIEEESGL